jgi:hypothetical protein
MKKLIVLLLLPILVFGQSSEIRRPTADIDGGTSNWVVTHCQFGVASTLGDVHLAYDAAGQATSVNLLRHGGRFNTVLGSKVFYTWQSPINAYTALTLNVNSSSNGYTTFSNFGAACIMYSLDNGANWIEIVCDDSGRGWPQTTNIITLSPTQDLSKLRVGACVYGDSGEGVLGAGGGDNILLFDIWTNGTTSGSSVTGSATQGRRNAIFVF